MQQKTPSPRSTASHKIDLIRRIDLITLRLFIAICEETQSDARLATRSDRRIRGQQAHA